MLDNNTPKRPRKKSRVTSKNKESFNMEDSIYDSINKQPPSPPEPPKNVYSNDNQPPFKKDNKMDESNRNIVIVALIVVCLIIGYFVCTGVCASVPNAKYHVKQTAISGEIVAYMRPGMYWKNFGDVIEWPVAETFYFTKDTEGGDDDDSIEVRFNDGSICSISGTCRVDLPKIETDAITLSSKLGYHTFKEVEDKLLLPVIRRSLVMTANLMSAKESYSERRSEFFQRAWDQIENGIYLTKDETVIEEDSITGAKINKIKKVILTNEKGEALREKTNPIHDTGIKLSNFEIKNFVYEDKVQKQIGAQQEAMMSVQTARANALKAQQDALTVEAQGKADVMKSKYIEEQEKVKAEVKADKERNVAVICAQKQVDVAQKEKEQSLIAAARNKEVASIELDVAKLEKQRQIELGTGEAERKRLVMAADGALEKKLEALVKIQDVWAAAFKDRKVPTTIMGGGASGSDNDVTNFMQLMTLNAAQKLNLDMDIQSSTPKVDVPKK